MVREALARRRLSREQLAATARISLSTLEKGLSGQRPFTLPTLVRLEDALDVRLRPPEPERATAQAPLHFGAYRREGVEWIAGTYLTLRRSFQRTDAISAYLTQIAWDDTLGRLIFRETNRRDAAFAQHGDVSMPYQSGHIYLVTNEQGQLRLSTLCRPTITGAMYGLLSTLRVGRGSRLTPISAPIALLPLAAWGADDAMLGLVTGDMSVFAAYRAEVDRVVGEGFGILSG